jgi:hypothetical protein
MDQHKLAPKAERHRFDQKDILFLLKKTRYGLRNSTPEDV